MKKYKKITKNQLTLSIINCCVFVLVYFVFFYELNILCKYGRVGKITNILFGCLVFFIVWLIMLVTRLVKRPKNTLAEEEEKGEEYSRIKNKFTLIAVILAICVTGFYGTKIYHSGTKYNGKLAWYLEELKNKRLANFQHDNIYKDGIEGIIQDVNEKVHMPKKLYMVNNFTMKFDSNGKILSLDTFLYGKNDKGQLQTYLISYDRNKSDKIIIYLNGYAKPDYNKDKLLEPFFTLMKKAPLKKTVSNWSEKAYSINYHGRKSFSSNVIYLDSKGKIIENSDMNYKMVGYTLSVFVPEKLNEYQPVRYSLIEGANKEIVEPYNEENSHEETNSSEKFYLSKKVGYRLEVVAAAAGSRSYALEKTTDRVNWTTINQDPFNGDIGIASGITFLDSKLGFLGLSFSGGSRGELYRTNDGGISYKKVDFTSIKKDASFDLPTMPYKKGGKLYVLIGKGSDGDKTKELYQSTDEGVTWKYIKDVP
ncbi:WD40/YVTN/BNR-like repeat-containing protein [Clostridium felsineum]|uniref:Uncharacterized protein n=1 Tax=Clostridium felsineum TaxID=36839 RepID=A0A1S8LHN0_9CLOT|nr:hypothetical protein [Clostridium felsineum]URZ08583.1 hypothetical protein CLROS_039650 [Clostridium felsineum]URZ13614.1 hypothetical protein CROST_043800 [Clostridium felsineum]